MTAVVTFAVCVEEVIRHQVIVEAVDAADAVEQATDAVADTHRCDVTCQFRCDGWGATVVTAVTV